MLSVLVPLIATINDDVTLFQQWHQQVDGGFDWSTGLHQHHHPPAEDACHTHMCRHIDAAALLSAEDFARCCLMLTAYLGLSKEAMNSLRSLKPCRFLPSPGASQYHQHINTV